MAQYFEWDERLDHQESTYTFSLRNKSYTMDTNAGVFSKDKLDTGTRLLLETVLDHQEKAGSLLDLGCGIGPVGVVLSSEWDCKTTMIDVNPKALELAKKNMNRIHKEATYLCQDGIQEGMFDCILLNPPIRTGKEVIYRLFDECIAHCKKDFWLVIRKQHGAVSAQKYLEKQCEVKRMARDKGYWVLHCTNFSK